MDGTGLLLFPNFNSIMLLGDWFCSVVTAVNRSSNWLLVTLLSEVQEFTP